MRDSKRKGERVRRERRRAQRFTAHSSETQDLARLPGEELLRGDQCQGAASTVGKLRCCCFVLDRVEERYGF